MVDCFGNVFEDAANKESRIENRAFHVYKSLPSVLLYNDSTGMEFLWQKPSAA